MNRREVLSSIVSAAGVAGVTGETPVSVQAHVDSQCALPLVVVSVPGYMRADARQRFADAMRQEEIRCGCRIVTVCGAESVSVVAPTAAKYGFTSKVGDMSTVSMFCQTMDELREYFPAPKRRSEQ